MMNIPLLAPHLVQEKLGRASHSGYDGCDTISSAAAAPMADPESNKGQGKEGKDKEGAGKAAEASSTAAATAAEGGKKGKGKKGSSAAASPKKGGGMVKEATAEVAEGPDAQGCNRDAFMPFGFGPRACLGQISAQVSVALQLQSNLSARVIPELLKVAVLGVCLWMARTILQMKCHHSLITLLYHPPLVSAGQPQGRPRHPDRVFQV